MSVPGATSLMGGGPPSIADQVKGETEEERRKRLLKMQAAKQLPVGASSLGQGYGTALGSP
jgi:hypothetical protein